ncbi:MAG: M6 family metalloprotease domain-containing protein [Muribaculaceae bacterium]
MKQIHKASAMLCAAVICGTLAGRGVPAYPWPQTVVQPDGSEITYILQGDEYSSRMTSTDGYLLMRDGDGAIRYADRLSDGTLQPSVLAHDMRDAAEVKYLKTRSKENMALRRDVVSYAPMRAAGHEGFRGLVILANYTNQKLAMPGAQDFYSRMINDENYTGYVGQDGNYVGLTGSVRDYFRDNSGGVFAPEFDVVGPVELNVPSTFAMQMQNATQLISLVVAAADPLVDFSQYDSDGDGRIDMFYVIFAGQGSNYTGGSEIWPHKAELPGVVVDGVSTWTYACSAELSGAANEVEIDGIGTICHEFSHVLGMVDEYDTDYSLSGGEADHPNTWSLMSMGCYLNHGRTPVGYSAYERIQAGFMEPEDITLSGAFSLSALESEAKAFRINSIVGDEFFIIENRQPIKWDKALPGHGMMVYHVDRTDPELWATNRVNRDPEHPCYQMLSACPQYDATALRRREDSAYDPFPGSGNVTELTNQTSPSLLSNYGYNSNVTIHNICEQEGVVSFDANVVPNKSYTEKWSLLGDKQADGTYKGSIASWEFENNAELDTDGSMVTFVKRSQITSSPIAGQVSMLKLNIVNDTRSSAIFQVKYSLDGHNWLLAKTLAGDERVTLEKGSSCSASYAFDDIDLNTEADLRLRIIEFSGVADERCAIGDLEFYMLAPQIEADKLHVMLPEMEYVDAQAPGYPVSFVYQGTSPVTSIDYSWTIGSMAGHGTYLFDPALDEANRFSDATITLSGLDTYGDFMIDFSVTAINGQTLAEPITVDEAEVRVIPFTPINRPLVEEYAGLRCSACPKGYVFMEQMSRDFKDIFVGLSYHSKSFEGMDGMACLLDNQFPMAIQSLPSGSVNRLEVTTIENLRSKWNAAIEKLAPASIEVSLSADDNDPNIIHAQAEAVFIRHYSDVDCAISIALVADNLKNQYWGQNNGFAGSTNPELTGDLWDIFTKGDDEVYGLTFNDIVVAYPDVFGIDNSVPSEIEINRPYTASLDFRADEIRNVWGQEFLNADAKLRAVACIIDRHSGQVLNAASSEYLDREPSAVSTISGDADDVISVKYYDVTGRQIEPTACGIVIKREILSSGNCRVTKMLSR